MQKPHPLSLYLEKTGEKQADLARRANLSQSYLSLIMSWKRGASLAAASRLERATGGKVKATSMVRPDLYNGMKEAAE